MIDRIRDTRVFGLGGVVVVDFARLGVEDHVFQQRVALDGAEYVGFVLCRKVDALGVAASFEVEYAFLVPAVLVVADKGAVRVG